MATSGVLPLMTTGGGLVFGGDVNGNFRAFDQDTGKVLWEMNLGSPVNGFPVAYTANGKQYVAVTAGGADFADFSLTLVKRGGGHGRLAATAHDMQTPAHLPEIL